MTFHCQLDSQAIEVGCASPRGYVGLAVGDHTFKVWATDGAGNADPTPATRTWTVISADTGAGTVPPPPGGATPDTTAPVATLSFTKQRLARMLKRGFASSALTTEAGTLRVDVLYRGRAIGTVQRVVGAPGRMKLIARLTAKGKRVLAGLRSAKLTLRLTATDAAGNETVKKKTLTLKR